MTATDTTTPTEPRRVGEGHPAIVALKRASTWLIPMLVTMLGAWLLLNRINEPPRIIFDEVYYVGDANSFLATGGVEDSFAVHPPVGKWMIAASIKVFGDVTVGWRLAGVLAGTGMVLLTYLLALRLLRTRWQAALAAGLLALDGLFLVQARTSMLDIFLAFFVLLGAWLLVRDIQDLDVRGGSAHGLVHRSLANRWMAGAAFGLAIATKWSGLLALGTTIVLVVGFEVIAHRRNGRKGIGLTRLLWVVIGPLIFLPALVYLGSYVPWMVNYEYTTEGKEDCPGAAEGESVCEASAGDRLHGLWREHGDIYRFHRDLESTHGYRAEPWTFPVLGRPVAYYYETCKADRTPDQGPCEIPEGMAAEVLALGNPALWWGFLALLPLSTTAMGRRDPSAWVLGGFYGALYLPWMLVSRPAFLFYMVPAIAFMAVTVAHALGRLRHNPTDALPWLAGGGAGIMAGVSAMLVGAPKHVVGIAFGIGWVFAPLVVAFVWERVKARSARIEAEIEAEFARAEAAIPAAEIPDVIPPEVVIVEHEGVVTVEDEAAPVAVPSTREREEPLFVRWWPSRRPATTASAVPAIVVGGLLVLTAVGLFIWFLPVWTGIPMEPEALRARWWFSSWV